MKEKPARKPLLVVDFIGDGHHSAHVCHLVAHGLTHDRTDLNFLVTRELYQNALPHLSPDKIDYLNGCVHFLDDDPLWTWLVRWSPQHNFTYWLYFEYLNLRERNRSRLLFLYFDCVIYGAALLPLPRFNISGVFFRPTFYYRQRKMLPAKLADRAVFALKWVVAYLCVQRTGVKRLFVFDPLAEDYAKTSWQTKKIDYVPDPMGPEAAVERLSAPSEPLSTAPVKLLLAGALAPRKGLHWVVDALAHVSAETRKNVLLVIVGRPEQGFGEYVQKNLERLASIDIQTDAHIRFVTDSEMDQFFESADVVLTPYMGFKGSSGIVIRAAHFGKPVISTDEGLLGYLVVKHGLGESLDVSNTALLSQCIDRVVALRTVQVFDAERARAFANSSDPSGYVRALSS